MSGESPEIFTCAPNSTTCSGGMPKNAVGPWALRDMKAKIRSLQMGMSGLSRYVAAVRGSRRRWCQARWRFNEGRASSAINKMPGRTQPGASDLEHAGVRVNRDHVRASCRARERNTTRAAA